MSFLKSQALSHPVSAFLLLTFMISITAFVFIAKVPGANSPEGLPGLPIWLIAVWAPSLAALTLKYLDQSAGTFLKNAFSFSAINRIGWVALLPLFIMAAVLVWEVKQGTLIDWGQFKMGYLLPLLLINLILGPLGEELGWRAYLGPLLESRFGLVGSAFVVGLIWALWHGPLWFVDSPQRQIPYLIFAANVICFAIIMATIYRLGGGSLIPVILFHLFINVASGVVAILDLYDNYGVYYQKTLLPYTLVALGCLAYWGHVAATAGSELQPMTQTP